MDVFCLRERDLLERFAAEVSQHQAQGKNKDQSFILVRTFLFLFLKLPLFLSSSFSPWHSFLSLFVSTFPIPKFEQSHQLAEDLGRAYSERAIFVTFIEAEATLPAGPLKVYLNICCS